MILACSGYRGSRIVDTECRSGSSEGTGMIRSLPFWSDFVVKAYIKHVSKMNSPRLLDLIFRSFAYGVVWIRGFQKPFVG